MSVTFLCASHRQAISSCSTDELYSYWQHWMDEGYCHYERSQFIASLKYMGNARDVCQTLIRQEGVNLFNINDLLICTLFINNIANRLHEQMLGATILSQTLQFFGHHLGEQSVESSVRDAMKLLVDIPAHADYVNRNSSYTMEPISIAETYSASDCSIH